MKSTQPKMSERIKSFLRGTKRQKQGGTSVPKTSGQGGKKWFKKKERNSNTRKSLASGQGYSDSNNNMPEINTQRQQSGTELQASSGNVSNASNNDTQRSNVGQTEVSLQYGNPKDDRQSTRENSLGNYDPGQYESSEDVGDPDLDAQTQAAILESLKTNVGSKKNMPSQQYGTDSAMGLTDSQFLESIKTHVRTSPELSNDRSRESDYDYDLTAGDREPTWELKMGQDQAAKGGKNDGKENSDDDGEFLGLDMEDYHMVQNRDKYMSDDTWDRGVLDYLNNAINNDRQLQKKVLALVLDEYEIRQSIHEQNLSVSFDSTNDGLEDDSVNRLLRRVLNMNIGQEQTRLPGSDRQSAMRENTITQGSRRDEMKQDEWVAAMIANDENSRSAPGRNVQRESNQQRRNSQSNGTVIRRQSRLSDSQMSYGDEMTRQQGNDIPSETRQNSSTERVVSAMNQLVGVFDELLEENRRYSTEVNAGATVEHRKNSTQM